MKFSDTLLAIKFAGMCGKYLDTVKKKQENVKRKQWEPNGSLRQDFQYPHFEENVSMCLRAP
jgi:hypothetical protein